MTRETAAAWFGTLRHVSEQPSLSIKWVIIGFGVQGGLSWLLPALLAEPLAPPLVDALGLTAGLLALAVLVAFGAFFGGALLVALVSSGNTIKEPAIASTLAIAVNQAYYLSHEGTQLSVLGIAISVVMAYAFAFAGAKVGEKLQGDTTDKMRERGDLRR